MMMWRAFVLYSGNDVAWQAFVYTDDDVVDIRLHR